MLCPGCGFENENDNKFCNMCGMAQKKKKKQDIPPAEREQVSLDNLSFDDFNLDTSSGSNSIDLDLSTDTAAPTDSSSDFNFDLSLGIDKILDMIGDTKIIGVLITHAHFDHVGALDDLLKEYNVPIYYHNINKELNYEKLIDVKEQEYKIDNFIFSVIYTPGHRNDSVTYLFKDTMFTGDFLFHLSKNHINFSH